MELRVKCLKSILCLIAELLINFMPKGSDSCSYVVCCNKSKSWYCIYMNINKVMP